MILNIFFLQYLHVAVARLQFPRYSRANCARSCDLGQPLDGLAGSRQIYTFSEPTTDHSFSQISRKLTSIDYNMCREKVVQNHNFDNKQHISRSSKSTSTCPFVNNYRAYYYYVLDSTKSVPSTFDSHIPNPSGVDFSTEYKINVYVFNTIFYYFYLFRRVELILLIDGPMLCRVAYLNPPMRTTTSRHLCTYKYYTHTHIHTYKFNMDILSIVSRQIYHLLVDPTSSIT